MQQLLVYDGLVLYDCYDPHKGWVARSGPWGRGRAPAGLYEMARPTEIAPHPSYRDGTGFTWWAALSPLFPTERSGFGIHPDGGIAGTKGCIGITDRDTRPCFAYLQDLSEEKTYVVVLPDVP